MELPSGVSFHSTSQAYVADHPNSFPDQPMTVLDKPLDLACIETQIGDGSLSDCEILELDTTGIVYKLQLPLGA